jgi:hypothetical protein
MNAKLAITLATVKRFVLPVVVGTAVVWLVSNGYDDWASALCSASDAVGINVTECK